MAFLRNPMGGPLCLPAPLTSLQATASLPTGDKCRSGLDVTRISASDFLSVTEV